MSGEPHDERRCGNCRHFEPDADESCSFGNCFAHPPQPINKATKQQSNKGDWIAWLFPEVFPEFWCGEWAPRRSPKQ